MVLKELIKQEIARNPYLHRHYVTLRDWLYLIIWLMKGRPVPPPHIVKQRRVLWAQKFFGLQTLVETGTFMGDMVNATLHAFDTIYSIELSDDFWHSAKNKFANYPNVHILQGDSATVLPLLVKDIRRPTLFWLDAHYSGDNTAKGLIDTPIAAELNCIFEGSANEHVILIDDARCFVGKDDYPAIEELRSFVVKANPSYNFDIRDDIIEITPK